LALLLTLVIEDALGEDVHRVQVRAANLTSAIAEAGGGDCMLILGVRPEHVEVAVSVRLDSERANVGIDDWAGLGTSLDVPHVTSLALEGCDITLSVI
jgi:hypothetical protein